MNNNQIDAFAEELAREINYWDTNDLSEDELKEAIKQDLKNGKIELMKQQLSNYNEIFTKRGL